MKITNCQQCNKKLEGYWQLKFCSNKCSIAAYRSSRQPIDCPHCKKQLKASWNRHINQCLEKKLQKQIKKQKWLDSLRINRIKSIICLGCGTDFTPTYDRKKFCSVLCYRQNSVLVITPETRKKKSVSASKQMHLRYASGWEPT